MEKIELKDFRFSGSTLGEIADLRTLDAADKAEMLMSGIDVEERERAGSYLQVDHGRVHCKSLQKGVEVLDIKDALAKYDGLPDYYWTQVDKDKDEFTRSAAENLHGGYFVRTEKGAKVVEPVQSCLFLKGDMIGQNVHNVIIVEDDSELHIITGCSVAHGSKGAAHLGITEIFVGKNAKLTFTMIHNWAESTVVRPRTGGTVEEGGVFINNYVLLKPVKDLQSYPVIRLNGQGAVARFNSVIVAPKGSHVDTGSRIELNAPDTKGEIISRTIASGGTIIARGFIGGNSVPAKGHLECKGLILGGGVIHAIPELLGSVDGVELSHEAAVGKIAQEEIEYLMARGLDEEEATSTIVRGFLNVDIMGLPKELQDVIEATISESEKDMF
ncbi:MAG: ABC-type transport system involved in Fe-S cluster assembly, permease component [Solidesulfovibrio magneticus str. Maddingley MBC34]|uniref:ABC-type transport system involved in Fe-S cluster assembly, permease component n=1 Tax=Solidesulfovibrio magneticus str. Maddingley MBC34 TaxID=1206767 RepID=K6GUB3_9BACT|nr:MAG: ABC-type transport system involved in Fe-S cluster assembly, permease component [Solidesulfovibrio magneticus str. Maddingley MBC34]